MPEMAVDLTNDSSDSDSILANMPVTNLAVDLADSSKRELGTFQSKQYDKVTK